MSMQRCNMSKEACPLRAWMCRTGIPADEAAVSALRLKECVLAPSMPSLLHVALNCSSTVFLLKCSDTPPRPGKMKSCGSGSFLNVDVQTSFHVFSSSASFGFKGIVRVFFLPFVTAFGITMSVAVALLHFSESASEIRQAVNLVVDSTARSFGEHSLMMLSSWSVDKTRACPHPPLFGIYF